MAGIHYIVSRIRTEPLQPTASAAKLVDAFSEERRYGGKKQDMVQLYSNSRLDCSPMAVANFVVDILSRGSFDVAVFLFSIIYLEELTRRTAVTLHCDFCRPLFVTVLTIADKTWEDLSVTSASVAHLFPVVNSVELYDLEFLVLHHLDFRVQKSVKDFERFCTSLLNHHCGHDEIHRLVHQTFGDLWAQEIRELQKGSMEKEEPFRQIQSLSKGSSFRAAPTTVRVLPPPDFAVSMKPGQLKSSSAALRSSMQCPWNQRANLGGGRTECRSTSLFLKNGPVAGSAAPNFPRRVDP